MNNLKLDLGQFNQCVDYLPGHHGVDYPVDSSKEVFYYSDSVTDKIVSAELTGEYINIPTVDFGAAAYEGLRSDPEIVRYLLACIELNVFDAIKKILDKVDKDCKLKNIRIPIRKIEIFDDDKHMGCYGWAEVGIAVFM